MLVGLCLRSKHLVTILSLPKVTILLICWRKWWFQDDCWIIELIHCFGYNSGVSTDYFNGPVGRAYVGTMCNSHHDACGVIVDNAERSATFTATILAHEMGHNFGMQHDDNSCSCRKACVMAPAIGYWTPFRYKNLSIFTSFYCI